MIPPLLLAALAAQEPAAAAAPSSEIRWEELQSQIEGAEVVYRIRGLDLQAAEDTVVARHAVLRLDLALYRAAVSGAAPPAPGPPAPLPQAPRTLSGTWHRRLLAALGAPPDVELLRHLELSGDVSWQGAQLELRCQRLSWDLASGVTEAEDADLLLSQEMGPGGWPLRILAELLREDPDGALHGYQAALTTCDLAAPHYELRLRELHGRPLNEQDWAWTSSGAWLALADHRVLPLPAPAFRTGESFLSVRGARFQSNSRVGQALAVEVGGASTADGGADFDWSLAPGASTRRGFPLDGRLDYRNGPLHSTARLFYLHDLASDVHPFRSRVAPESEQRWRAYLDNRLELGDSWRLDLDLALSSDPLVDPEFYSREWREEADANSELYLRRAGDGSFLDLWTVYRLNDHGFTPLEGYPRPGADAPPTLDTLPIARFEQYARELLQLPAPGLGGADGTAPLNWSWGAEIGRLRLRDRRLETPAANPPYSVTPAVASDRARLFSELATSLNAGGWFLRPGARLQAVGYDDGLGGTSLSRGFAEAFVETGSLWIKDWPHGWQHRVLPQLRVRSMSRGGDRLGAVPRFDAVDRLRAGQVVELSLRQLYYAPGAAAPWVDLDFLIPYYPDPTQPLRDGVFPAPKRGTAPAPWGPAELRATWTPAVYGKTLEGVRWDARWRQDLHQARLDELFTRLTISPDERLDYGVEWLKVNDRFSVAQVFFDWRLAESWGIRWKQPYHFTGRAGKEAELAVLRYAHDFVVEIGVRRDQAAGETGVFFNFVPRFLVDRPAAPPAPRIGS